MDSNPSPSKTMQKGRKASPKTFNFADNTNQIKVGKKIGESLSTKSPKEVIKAISMISPDTQMNQLLSGTHKQFSMQKNQSEHSAFNSDVTRKIITDQQTSPLRRVDTFSLNTYDENRSNEETRFESSPFPSPPQQFSEIHHHSAEDTRYQSNLFPSPPQQSTDDNHHFIEDKNFQSSSFPSPPQQSSDEHHHSSENALFQSSSFPSPPQQPSNDQHHSPENGMFKSRSFPSPPQEFSRVPTRKQENLKHLTNYPKKKILIHLIICCYVMKNVHTMFQHLISTKYKINNFACQIAVIMFNL